jgi:hypothetical protein
MQNIKISIYERGGRKLNKILTPFMSRVADALEKVNWFSGQGAATCLTKIETCLIREVAAGLETMHVSVTKEAAATSIPAVEVFQHRPLSLGIIPFSLNLIEN